MDNDFNGFSLFKDIDDDPILQAYNRCVTMFNINDLHSDAMSVEYAEQIPEEDRMTMLAMYNYIIDTGLEETKRQYNNGELFVGTEEQMAAREAENATIN